MDDIKKPRAAERRKEPVSLPGRPSVPASLPDFDLDLPKEAPDVKGRSQTKAALAMPPGKPPKKSRKGLWAVIIVGIVVLLLVAGAVGAKLWYDAALQPASTDAARKRVEISQGATLQGIAQLLQDEGIIKSSLAFRILARQTGDLKGLQAGTYLLSPEAPAKEIFGIIAEGKVDSYSIRISPGLSLKKIRASLIKDGFTEAEVDAALAADYDHPVFAGKPADASLEGYIFPDTYEVTSQTTVKELLVKSFDHFYDLIKEESIDSKLKDRDFTLYQGITLASIVQKEVSEAEVQRQVAQVFEQRLKVGMSLGSDVTFMYAAELLGVPESLTIDSPYNTRRYDGLPPGPIANFNLSALQAVANPAPGDYLFFVAGDDGTTYFSHTAEEHEAKVRAHCTKLCN